MALRLLKKNVDMPDPAPSPLDAYATAKARRGELRSERHRLRQDVLRLERELYESAAAGGESYAEQAVAAVMRGEAIPELASVADQLKATRQRLDVVNAACARFDEEVYTPAARRAKRWASQRQRDAHREIIRKQIEHLTALSDLIAEEDQLRGKLARDGLLCEQTLPAASFPNVGNRHVYGTPANTWLRWLSQHGFGFED